jgi:RNA polymerase sigma factor (sigma-70 family)
VEVSALTHKGGAPGLRGASPLLRLQSDERLIALTRRGQYAAFEALCARYQARLLSFIRHMLGCREDAEDVLQEVLTAAFNAILADEREINVRPWLYRIARNRSLNHLRRASAVGVDSMDVHFADHGLSTGDRVLRRESFRELLADVQRLPETQRTALLLREIDALSYEQIALAMDTTVPSVKSLLVRARMSLAEAAEARKLSCEEVRLELGEVAEGLITLSSPARRHVRDCDRCRFFRKQLKDTNHALAAILPIGPLLLIKKLIVAKLSSTASAGSAHVASGAGATVTAGAAAGASIVGGAGAGGVFTVGAGALATKAVAGLAAAAIVSAGAVAANQPSHHRRAARQTASATVPARERVVEPLVVSASPQPVTAASSPAAAGTAHPARSHKAAKPKPTPASTPAKSATPVPPPVTTPVVAPTQPLLPAATVPPQPAKPPAAPEQPTTQITQVTTETTQLPASATGPAVTSTTPPPPPAAESAPATPTSPPAAPPAAEAQPPSPPPATTAPAVPTPASTGGTPPAPLQPAHKRHAPPRTPAHRIGGAHRVGGAPSGAKRPSSAPAVQNRPRRGPHRHR